MSDNWLNPAWSFPYRIARKDIYHSLETYRSYVSGKLLDLACGPKPYQPFLASATTSYFGLDYFDWDARVDVIGSSEHLPFAAGAFDTLLCTEGLEHFRNPTQVMGEIKRVLAQKGYAIITTPLTWGLHGEPHDYWRFTIYGLQALAEQAGLVVIESHRRGGGFKVVGQMIARGLDTTLSRPQERLRSGIVKLAALILSPGALLQLAFTGRPVSRAWPGLQGRLNKWIPPLPFLRLLILIVNWLATHLDRRFVWPDETLGFTVVVTHTQDSH